MPETSTPPVRRIPFPRATILGYPRIGPNRELKRALESHWAGRSTAAELEARARELRASTRAHLVELGLDPRGAAVPESFSFYDQVLDATALLGAIPPRFAGLGGLDLYFALARGTQDVAPLELTKWFDTNYHYLVPEIGPDTPIALASRAPVDQFREARAQGIVSRPTLVGPVSYLALAKAGADAPDGYSPLLRLDDVVAAYARLLRELADAGAPWVQLDEPALVTDNLDADYGALRRAARRAYGTLAALPEDARPALFVTTPYGEASDALPELAETGVEALHVDLVRGRPPRQGVDAFARTTLVGGVVDGLNVWANDLSRSLGVLRGLERCAPRVAVATSTSLLHVPHDVAAERWPDPEVDRELHEWLAFADQKVCEVGVLARGLAGGDQAIAAELAASRDAVERRRTARGVVDPDVRGRQERLTDAERRRAPYAQRAAAQQAKLRLPQLPTTTIGSFPQTPEIRRARAAHARGELTDAAYEAAIKRQIAHVIRVQEDLGLDVLVHGEPERNDMVQYFAERLRGFAVTRHGWVQSYGSRCTRPSILWGDVSRPGPITVRWTTYAQSLTDRPVKGMLTGPTTILAWSFVRDDLPLGQVADQIALALRDEIHDLEAAGTPVIQVDEPALRELLPLRRSDQAAYLDWAVGAFRLATSGVRPDTQIHTHLCYSEFGRVLPAIDGLGADVTSLEAARSGMGIVPELVHEGFGRGVGPGVYDIHSPRVPSTAEIVGLLHRAVGPLPAGQLWVNPDCGLKTRSYAEVLPSLAHLVEAAHEVRQGSLAPAGR